MRTSSSAHCRQFLQHLRHAADSMHSVPRNTNHNGHLQHKLKQIGPQHAPETSERNVNPREWHKEENANRQRLRIADAHRRTDDVHHGFGNPTEDQTIHQQSEIYRAETAQKCGSFSAIAEFGELHVGDQAGGAATIWQKEKRSSSRMARNSTTASSLLLLACRPIR